MRVYLDACCISRLTDGTTEPRVRAETEKILQMLAGVEQGELVWVLGQAVELELERDPEVERRDAKLSFLKFADERVQLAPNLAPRSQELRSFGLEGFDRFI